MADHPCVGIVIVNYNCAKDILRCIASLERLDFQDFVIVVVDSCSPDNSGTRLAESLHGSRIVVICSTENRGFAAASNIGIKHTQALEVDCVWLLNPDTEVDEKALSALLAQAKNKPEAAAFGSKILYGKSRSNNLPGEQIIWGAGGTIDFQSRQLAMRGTAEPDRGQYNTAQECDYIPGCSLLFRASCLEQVGYLPEDYFMYFEETEWCTKIKENGQTLYYVPESIVWHHFDDHKMQEAFTVYYYNRNERFFWFRRSSLPQKARLVAKTICRDIPRVLCALWAAPDERQREIFRAHLAGAVDFLLCRRGKRRSFSR
jgi:GT2 family glycosyltransferase